MRYPTISLHNAVVLVTGGRGIVDDRRALTCVDHATRDSYRRAIASRAHGKQRSA